MVNTRKPPTVAAAPTPPQTLLIGSERDAREAFGADHGLEVFFRRPVPAPAIYVLPHSARVLPPAEFITIAGPSPEWWHRVEVSQDPEASPPLACRLDGMPIELEQHLDGVWRPRRAESDG